MGQAESQKLLALALSAASGVPLRYCIQHEILPAAKYWAHNADRLTSESHSKVHFIPFALSNLFADSVL